MPHTDELVTPGELVKTARLRAGMKQQELADRLDVHRNTVGAWENPRDTAEPSARQFFEIIKVTNQAGLIEQLTRNNDIVGLSLEHVLPGQMSLLPLLESAA